jgi:hypothetical protein
VAKLVVRLLAEAALWVRIPASLKNKDWRHLARQKNTVKISSQVKGTAVKNFITTL